ncbi:hypothetical protein EV182_000989 [Spiromyces aspiralis]|uniref:Uncharacterized protein n=1 Tax=Spiromyces aspiralis TaxID=68401 RepID=A0ACC1HK18_9FUNG|nr:hypothetical protein EV182_000989 [Spiromyces aspiralis]
MITIINQQQGLWLPMRVIRYQLTGILRQTRYGDWDLGVYMVDSVYMQQLNRTYRNKDKPTDILSFPFHEVACIPSSPLW